MHAARDSSVLEHAKGEDAAGDIVDVIIVERGNGMGAGE